VGEVDLGGTWRAVEADEELRRSFPAPDLDDSTWATLSVPGHWSTSSPFAASLGPLLYRRRFETAPLGPQERAWLVMEGLFYHADLWLDGSYVGDTEGYFFPYSFDVTAQLGARREHVLAVEVACERPPNGRALMGAWDDPAFIDPAWSPGGIWGPVRLFSTGPVRIASASLACTSARPEQAALEVSLTLDSSERLVAAVRTEVRLGEEAVAVAERHQPLALGPNRLRWPLVVPRPELWWPAGLGPQPLYEVYLSVSAGGLLSDAKQLRTGLRQVRMRKFKWQVNGEPVFLKGAELLPTRRDLASPSATEVARSIELAQAAGLNLLRTRAHVARKELYEAADSAGMLIWQDMPIYGHYRGGRREAMRQAEKAVEVLGHHPSVIGWCGLCPAPPRLRKSRLGRELSWWAAELLPSAANSFYGPSIRRALERADPSRPAIASHNLLAQSYGWRRGEVAGLRRLVRLWPAAGRFPTGLGAQAVPESAAFMEPGRWPELDWARLGAKHCMERAVFAERAPPSRFESFDAWRAETQRYQAGLVREQVEWLRLLRNGAVGGFCVSSLADAQEAVSASLVDATGRPKPAYEALTAACQAVIAVAAWPPGQLRAGSPVAIYAVNDSAGTLLGATLEVKLAFPGGGRSWRFAGEVPAQSACFIGRVLLPELPPGEARLSLRLSWSPSEGGEQPGSAEAHYSLPRRDEG
jgi:beta-mannosidase